MIDGEKNTTVCKISVIDNGPGIPEEIKDSIFFPMITGKDKEQGLVYLLHKELFHNIMEIFILIVSQKEQNFL